MALKIGIVGLPNVGKSTLFNALTRTQAADAANYPFCTIEPNIGIVEVPDPRLQKLTALLSSQKTIPTTIEFVDIAGLVKGASEGEGLGNKFLAHIRECDAIAHVVRDFEDSNIIHVHGEIDPKLDREIIESELLLADIQTLEKRLEKAAPEAKSGDKEKIAYAELISRVLKELQSGILANYIDFDPEELAQLRDLHLITSKPHLYIVNLHESNLSEFDKQSYGQKLGIDNLNKIIPISAAVEEELAAFSTEEAKEYLLSLGLEETGLISLIRAAYETLGLITFFTSGPKETRAWTVDKGSAAPKAAGKIHTDFEKGFIKAEVVHYNDIVNAGGHLNAKEKGLLRIEGKDYTVNDGDVMHFKFSP